MKPKANYFVLFGGALESAEMFVIYGDLTPLELEYVKQGLVKYYPNDINALEDYLLEQGLVYDFCPNPHLVNLTK